MTPHGYHHGISVFALPLSSSSSSCWSATQFLKATESLSVAQRETIILRESVRCAVACGDAAFVPVSLEEGRLTINVLTDYFSIGTREDHIRIPMALFTAQKVADFYDCALPTTMMVDLIWRHASWKLTPRPLAPGPNMTSNLYFAKENALIQAQLPRACPTSYILVAGDKKDVVNTNQLVQHFPNSTAIYGWTFPNGTNIQPLFLGHASWYADYSHGLRLVSMSASLDGSPVSLDTLLRGPTSSQWLSYEGPLINGARVPVDPQFAPPCVVMG